MRNGTSRKTLRPLAIAAALAAGPVAAASAQNITDSANPARMTVATAIAGQQPTPVVDNSTQYRAKTNKANNPQKITGRLNTNMPAGVTLTIELEPTTGATSLGPVTLSTTTRDLVTNITNTKNEWRDIIYTLSATVDAGVVPLGSRTVTLTITNWP